MKKVIIMALMCLSVISVSAKEPCDTIAFKGIITKVITDISVSSTGKKTNKYYFIIDGYLVPTSKSVYEKYNLCKKYGAKCPLSAVRSKVTHQVKRIILG